MFKGSHVVKIVMILLIVFGGTISLSVWKNKHTIKTDVETYLLEQGYDKEDILYSYVVNKGSYFSIYMVAVIFTDEPGVEYVYGYKEKGIAQLEANNFSGDSSFIHLETNLN